MTKIYKRVNKIESRSKFLGETSHSGSVDSVKFDSCVISGPSNSLSLDDLVGQPEAIKSLKEFVRQINYKNVYSQWNINPPKGILLTGNPGLGKTASVRALAYELSSKVHLMELSYIDIASKWIDAPIESLKAFLNKAEELSRSAHVLIFIDEIDAMIPDRNQQLHETSMKRVNVFLEWMDGGLEAKKNITLIGATNYLDGVDKAALRPGRFDKIIEFKNLTSDAIVKGLQIHLKKKNLSPNRVGKIDWANFKNFISDGQFTGADLQDIITRVINKKIDEQLNILRKKYDYPIDDLADIAINNARNLPSKISEKDFLEIILEDNKDLKSCFAIGFQ